MLKYLQFLIIMMLFINLHAQDKIEIEEKKMKMSQGVQNGLSIFIPASDQKFTEKLWKKKMKDLKAKVSKVNNDLLAMNIDMYNISVYIAKTQLRESSSTFSLIWAKAILHHIYMKIHINLRNNFAIILLYQQQKMRSELNTKKKTKALKKSAKS